MNISMKPDRLKKAIVLLKVLTSKDKRKPQARLNDLETAFLELPLYDVFSSHDLAIHAEEDISMQKELSKELKRLYALDEYKEDLQRIDKKGKFTASSLTSFKAIILLKACDETPLLDDYLRTFALAAIVSKQVTVPTCILERVVWRLRVRGELPPTTTIVIKYFELLVKHQLSLTFEVSGKKHLLQEALEVFSKKLESVLTASESFRV